MRLDPVRLVSFANDVAAAFGLADGAGRPLVFEPTRGDGAARRLLSRLREALAAVRPAAQAPSVGDVLGALERSASAGARSTKARRRALAELVELIAQGTHRRAKRQERPRLLGELVLLFDLEASLGVAAGGSPEAALVEISRAVAAILAR